MCDWTYGWVRDPERGTPVLVARCQSAEPTVRVANGGEYCPAHADEFYRWFIGGPS